MTEYGIKNGKAGGIKTDSGSGTRTDGSSAHRNRLEGARCLEVIQVEMGGRARALMRILGGVRCWSGQNRRHGKGSSSLPLGRAVTGQESGPGSKKRAHTMSMIRDRAETVRRNVSSTQSCTEVKIRPGRCLGVLSAKGLLLTLGEQFQRLDNRPSTRKGMERIF